MADAIAAMNVALSTPSSHYCSCQPPPGSPPPSRATETTPCSPTPCPTPSTNQGSSQVEFMQLAQQFLDILKSLNIKQGLPPPPAATDKVKSEESPARASKLEFKTVNEVWDAKAYKYKIVESLTPPDEENELDQYIFVVRTRIDKDEKSTHHVDIKSAGLRDILRSVLRDVNGISLREEKPSVEQNLLFHYLSDLEAYRSNHTTVDDSTLRRFNIDTCHFGTTSGRS